MPYRRPEDELAKAKKKYYAAHPDMDPQSTLSKVMEFFGADEPYRNDSGSYDYRRQAYDEYTAANDPRASEWSLPEIPDETKYNVGAGLEQTLGGFSPLIQMLHDPVSATKYAIQQGAGGLNPGGYDPEPAPPPMTPLQDQLHDPEFMARIQGMTPEEIDNELAQWEPKLDPFPREWKGKRKGAADPVAGGIAYGVEQLNYSPWETADILSVVGPDSPATVARDMERFSNKNPDTAAALDIAGTAAMFPLELAAAGKLLGKGAKAGAKLAGRGAKKAASAARRRFASSERVADAPVRSVPSPRERIGQQLPANYTEAAAAPSWRREHGDGSVRDAINRAFDEQQAQRAQSVTPTLAAMGAGGAVGGAVGLRALDEKRKRWTRGEE